MRSMIPLCVLVLPFLTGCPTPEDEEPVLPACVERQELTNEMFVGGLVLEAGTCWQASERLRLSDGEVTVEEGVSIWFTTGVAVEVSAGGTLRMTGTEVNPIELTTGDPLVTWKGIQLSDSQGSGNAWSHVAIVNAGDDFWTGSSTSDSAVHLTGETTLSLDAVTFQGSQSKALIAHEDVALTANGTRFVDNESIAFMDVEVVAALGSETVFEGNANSWVSVAFNNTDAIDAPTTWQALAVPYRVETRIYVNSDWTLAPGTVVESEQDVSINVSSSGAVFAEGTEEAPIVFRGASAGTRGYWTGISLESGGTDDPVAYGALFDHVRIEDAGSDNWNGGADSISAVWMNAQASALFTNTTFRNSGGYGLWASVDARIDGFDSNHFVDNVRVMRLHPNRVGELAGTSTYSENDESLVRVSFGNNDTVTRDALWPNPGIPYELTTRTYVAAALTIEAGTVVEAAQSVSFRVEEEGSLRADGTSAEPVVFRGLNPQADAYWMGLEFRSNSPENVLTSTLIQQAGSDGWYGGGDALASLYVNENATLSLTDVVVEQGDGYGAILGSDASMSCSGVDMNDSNGIYSSDANGVIPPC